MAIKVKSHNGPGPGMGGTVRLGISGCIEPGVLRCRVDALVDVRDVAGGRLAEMRTYRRSRPEHRDAGTHRHGKGTSAARPRAAAVS